MKTSTIIITATAALVRALPQKPPGDDVPINCAKANANYCMDADIILRCDGDAIGTQARCSPNLSGYPPSGGVASCWESYSEAGDAACVKNCVVYPEPPDAAFTLASDECIPSHSDSETTPEPTYPPPGTTIVTSVNTTITVTDCDHECTGTPPLTEPNPPTTETHPPVTKPTIPTNGTWVPTETHPPPTESHPTSWTNGTWVPTETHPAPTEPNPPITETHPPITLPTSWTNGTWVPTETHPPPTEPTPPITLPTSWTNGTWVPTETHPPPPPPPDNTDVLPPPPDNTDVLPPPPDNTDAPPPPPDNTDAPPPPPDNTDVLPPPPDNTDAPPPPPDNTDAPPPPPDNTDVPPPPPPGTDEPTHVPVPPTTTAGDALPTGAAIANKVGSLLGAAGFFVALML